MKNVLVTGATGFVGVHVCNSLVSSGYDAVGTTRSVENVSSSGDYELRALGDIGPNTNWGPVLDGIDCIVHLAARVHVMSDNVEDPLDEFRRVNVCGTKNLAESAVAAGVKRIIYVSTIKVLGELTDSQAFRHADVEAPCDPYAVSKLEGEQALKRISGDKGLEVVILRPPLIYGPRVGGNFLRVLNLVSRDIPLPLGMIRNSRSMLAASNLCDVVQISLEHPAAASKTLLVADGEDVSTPDLFRMVGELMGKPVRLMPVPEKLLRIGGNMFRRSNEVARLCDSLQVDIENTKDVLNWSPRTSLGDGLRSTVHWYLQEERSSND